MSELKSSLSIEEILLNETTQQNIIKKFVISKFLLEINLKGNKNIIHYIDLIISIHDIPLEIQTIMDLLNLIKLTEKDKIEKYLDNYVSKLIEKANEFILEKFSNIRNLFGSKEFLNLPIQTIKIIINNENLIIDSENSVFYFLIMWIDKEFNSRKVYLKELLEYVRFDQMTDHFLLHNVYQIANKYKETEKQIILEKYNEAIQNKLGNKLIIPNQNKRLTYENRFEFGIKAIYSHVSEWDINERYYTDTVYAHGYEFYFFVRARPNPHILSTEPENHILYGYLRCASSLSQKYYLKIECEFLVELKNGAQRRIRLGNLIFESPNIALGMSLTNIDENWTTIINGDAQIIIDNKLTVTIMIKILPTDINLYNLM